jgi:hypothetical protein
MVTVTPMPPPLIIDRSLDQVCLCCVRLGLTADRQDDIHSIIGTAIFEGA